MEPRGGQTHDLMDDVRAVDWLPLEAALDRLSRGYERAFLENVGPLALEAAALARPARRPRATPPVMEKRRSRRVAATKPSFTEPVSISPPPDLEIFTTGQDAGQCVPGDVVEAEPPVPSIELGTGPHFVETDSTTSTEACEFSDNDAAATAHGPRRNLVDRVRDWLPRGLTWLQCHCRSGAQFVKQHGDLAEVAAKARAGGEDIDAWRRQSGQRSRARRLGTSPNGLRASCLADVP